MKQKDTDIATLAGGCFWCTENAIEKLPGVLEVISGYSGGDVPDPTYGQVSSGTTGHYESIQVKFNSNRISYKNLLKAFWKQIDPTSAIGQFSDIGPQYKTAIFYHDEDQRIAAEESKKEINESGRFSKAVATEIKAFENFYPADESHQNYAKNNTDAYERYYKGSGRPEKLNELWGEDKYF